ncbi:hypothetical protein K1719_028579 [Acacia pycnantha]|nr:hypothetical protein K1719_028579 [Acacia pycnantha]
MKTKPQEAQLAQLQHNTARSSSSSWFMSASELLYNKLANLPPPCMQISCDMEQGYSGNFGMASSSTSRLYFSPQTVCTA